MNDVMVAVSAALRSRPPKCSEVQPETLRRSDDRSRVHASSLRLMALTFMTRQRRYAFNLDDEQR